jgi:hypothetical protein
MYEVADKYEVVGLKELAKRNSAEAASTFGIHQISISQLIMLL